MPIPQKSSSEFKSELVVKNEHLVSFHDNRYKNKQIYKKEIMEIIYMRKKKCLSK